MPAQKPVNPPQYHIFVHHFQPSEPWPHFQATARDFIVLQPSATPKAIPRLVATGILSREWRIEKSGSFNSCAEAIEHARERWRLAEFAYQRDILVAPILKPVESGPVADFDWEMAGAQPIRIHPEAVWMVSHTGETARCDVLVWRYTAGLGLNPAAAAHWSETERLALAEYLRESGWTVQVAQRTALGLWFLLGIPPDNLQSEAMEAQSIQSEGDANIPRMA